MAQALGHGRPYVLFVSIPSRNKNLEALRRAVARLAQQGFPHALVIAGAKPKFEPPEFIDEIDAELPGAPGRVTWLGDTPDPELAALMSDADAFCLPSFTESFGLSALEAMACGSPVVASNRGSLPEVIGDAGLLTEPTGEAIASALARVLVDSELSRALRAAARARAQAMSWDRTATGWLRALQRAAEYG